jgi:lipid II:glycine glycyltransferase (peptidoglycan interpeptide bridge formation enzyme)
MNSKDVYREFSAGEPSIPIFSKGWWLDASAGPDGWNVAIVVRDGRIVASMPYVLHRRYGLRVIGQPPLTQKHGPWYRPSDGRPAAKLAHEKNLLSDLIDQLPPFDHFTQNWHYTCTNWLPFSWNGFQQTTRYTYILHSLDTEDKVWADFENSTRAECRKASERYKLRVRDDLPLDAFLNLNRLTYRRQGKPVPYSDEYVKRLDAACAVRDCRRIFIAEDQEGRHHAGNYIVWDEMSAYGLMAGSEPQFRNSGASSLCQWAAIRHAAGVTQCFDFTGSMIEPVERFFRGFGAVQTPYFNLRKTPSALLRTRQALLRTIQDRVR